MVFGLGCTISEETIKNAYNFEISNVFEKDKCWEIEVSYKNGIFEAKFRW